MLKGHRAKLHEIIFEAETTMGRLFDVGLLCAIFLSISVVLLESISEIDLAYGEVFGKIEWALTIFFTLEYLLRLYCVLKPLNYAFSFYGIIDLLAILPSYLSLVLFETHSFLLLRAFRLLRVFRILKLGRYVQESAILVKALHASRVKISVFIMGVLSMVLVVGASMYFIEGEASGFTSIPQGMYWAIVTMTTVGYGDLTPQTPLGQAVASGVMILGYGIIAVPTGIVSAEIAQVSREHANTISCPGCAREGHAIDAKFCRHCGIKL